MKKQFYKKDGDYWIKQHDGYYHKCEEEEYLQIIDKLEDVNNKLILKLMEIKLENIKIQKEYDEISGII